MDALTGILDSIKVISDWQRKQELINRDLLDLLKTDDDMIKNLEKRIILLEKIIAQDNCCCKEK